MSEPQKTIQFTHRYSRVDLLPYQFYGIKTALPIEKVETLCMYIQLVRAKLPLGIYSADDIGVDDGLELMKIFYKDQYPFEAIRSNEENLTSDFKIDFFDNWNDMRNTSLIHINSVAIPNASIKLFKYFEAFLKTETSPSQYPYYKGQLEKVQKVLTGGVIPKEWNWTNIFGNAVFGICYLPNTKPELVTRSKLANFVVNN